jgi:hypothetical protein
MSRHVVPALVTLLAACARTQPATPAAKASAANIAALRDAAFRDLRCPDALPAIKRSPAPLDPIEAVALSGQTAYGLSSAGRLWIWDGKTPARVLDPARFDGLARDGSVAVTRTAQGEDGARLEVRALPSNQPLDHVVLRDGGVPLAVSASGALLRVGLPRVKCNAEDRDDDLCAGTIAYQPPTSELARWAFRAGATEREFLSDCKQAALAARGGSFACLNEGRDVISWEDRESPGGSYTLRVAPEWTPPPGPRDNDNLPPHWRIEEHWLEMTSLRLSPGDDAIFVTYRAVNFDVAERGLPGHHGWRLERWTRDPARPGEGRFSRLAESPDSLCTKVLAASGDGGLIVLGGRGHVLTVRRAPRYAPEPLAVESAVDAVVSGDGTRILTGHVDGRLRLWDTLSLGLVAASQSPTAPAAQNR